MNPRVLFVISSDPRTSHRPAEAIRIAAGVGAWKQTDITLYLRDAAVLALREFSDELMDEENFTRYLPMLVESSRPIFVQRGSPLLRELGKTALPFEEIDDSRLSALTAQSNYVVRF